MSEDVRSVYTSQQLVSGEGRRTSEGGMIKMIASAKKQVPLSRETSSRISRFRDIDRDNC